MTVLNSGFLGQFLEFHLVDPLKLKISWLLGSKIVANNFDLIENQNACKIQIISVV